MNFSREFTSRNAGLMAVLEGSSTSSIAVTIPSLTAMSLLQCQKNCFTRHLLVLRERTYINDDLLVDTRIFNPLYSIDNIQASFYKIFKIDIVINILNLI